MSKIQKERRFAGLKKRNFVVEISKNYYEQPKTDKHGEVVICVLKAALPLEEIMLGSLVPKVLDKVTKAFPEVEFNFNPKAEAFIVSAKGKAICSEDDTFDKSIGESIACSKAQAKIYSVCSRIMKIIKEIYLSTAEYNQNVEDFLRMSADREMSYVKSK